MGDAGVGPKTSALNGVSAHSAWNGRRRSRQPHLIHPRFHARPAEQQFFSDGVSKQILDVLASVPDLRVIARSSSFAFQGTNSDVATIAAKLNVAYVLEGSVRKSGERVRVTTQLIRAADSSHIRSETFDRQAGDIFAIQDEIALAVVSQLQLKLLDAKVHSRRTTTDTEAYALFLQARYLLDQRGSESMRQACDKIRHVIELDPRYAEHGHCRVPSSSPGSSQI